ncbi:hypothetical protein [Actinacidiphila glaucinigra]|uniref:hypothetical protein n=1 Tax=Actinacidiphila glaucinigra TaxID=235986 RepID=UPI00366BC30E
MSGRPRRKVLWGVAGTMTVAAAVVTTTAFVGPTDASAAARTTAVADEAAGNPVQGNGNNRDNFGRLRTAEFLGVSVIVPSGTTQTVSARCPSRTEVTGGGFVLSSTDLAVLTSQRSGNGWTVTVRNRNGMTIPAPTARAVVECAAIVRDNNNW